MRCVPSAGTQSDNKKEASLLGLTLFSNNSPTADSKIFHNTADPSGSHSIEDTHHIYDTFFFCCCHFQVTSHFTEEFLFNAAISRLMGLTNTLNVSVPLLYLEINIQR